MFISRCASNTTPRPFGLRIIDLTALRVQGRGQKMVGDFGGQMGRFSLEGHVSFPLFS